MYKLCLNPFTEIHLAIRKVWINSRRETFNRNCDFRWWLRTS